MAEYDGAATEIFVVDLSLSQLPRVIAALSDLPDLEVLSFEGQTLDDAVPLDAEWRSRLESVSSRNCQHSLRSANGTAKHLQIYLWLDLDAQTVEVELVFWNGQMFPHDLPEAERDRRLEALVAVAEACRAGSHGARCLMSAEHNGPVEELLMRGEPHLLCW